MLDLLPNAHFHLLFYPIVICTATPGNEILKICVALLFIGFLNYQSIYTHIFLSYISDKYKN